MTVHIFLEVLLMEIRDLSISYPFCKKKKREKIEISLIRVISSLESQDYIKFEPIDQKEKKTLKRT